MSTLLNEYLKLGLREIAVISDESHEESGGYQTETETQVIAAKNAAGNFLKASAKLVKKFGPKGGRKTTVDTTPISESEYLRLIQNRPMIDTPTVRQDFERENAVVERKRQASSELQATAPRCPIHDVKMKLKSGSNGKFWGCSKYPNCKHTQSLSAGHKALAELT